MFLIRDNNGYIYNEVSKPTVVFDCKDSVLLKIGDRDKMEEYFDKIQNLYRIAGNNIMADDIVLMELPHDQEEIDKTFQICDYVGRLYERATAQ